MKKINEDQLRDRAASLREYVKIIEGETANQIGNVIGQVGTSAVNAVTAPARAIWDGAKWVGGQLADVGSGIVQGATTGGFDPLNPIASGKQAIQSFQNAGKPTQGAAPTGTTQPAQPAQGDPNKSRPGLKPGGDPKVWDYQQAMIAKGAKITADGLYGPATMQAGTQTGMPPPPGVKTLPGAGNGPTKTPGKTQGALPTTKPAAPTGTQVQTDDDGNHMITTADGKTMVVGPDGKPLPNGGRAPTQGALPATKPAAPTGMQAQGDDEGNTTITRPDGSTMVVGPNGQQIMPGSNPNLPQNKGVVNTIKNAVTGQGDFQKPTGFIPPTTVGESVGYSDEQSLARIIQLARGR
jgi:hypothetical protein